jgi:hypothetical protein
VEGGKTTRLETWSFGVGIKGRREQGIAAFILGDTETAKRR